MMYRVVIAEDEPLARQVLIASIQWEDHGMTIVAEAANGQEAWDAYREHKPDLIITDIRMPVMNGLELIERIRKHDRSTKIVVLSCLDEFDRVRKAFTLGISDYISKLTMTTDEMQHLLSRISQEMALVPEAKKRPADSLEQLQVKENLLKDFMFRSRFSVQEFLLFAGDMGWRINHASPILLCLIEIDDYSKLLERYKDDYGLLTKMSVLNVLDELLNDCAAGEVIYDNHNRYIVVFSSRRQQGDGQLQDELRDALERIRFAFTDYFGATLSIGVSEVYTGYANLRVMYRESRSALRRKFVLGASRTIGAQADLEDELSREAERAFAEMMNGWHMAHPQLEQQLKASVHEFLRRDEWEQGPVIDFFQLLLQMPIHVLKLSREHAWDHFQHYSSRLRQANSLREACETFTEYAHRTMQLREASPVWSREVMEAIRYMEREYCEEVTLTKLSSHVKLSSNYLGAMFKKETGFSPIEYLIQYRIVKAKELIAETDQRTYEIAEQVGISDYSYFSRMFKKMVGVSPSEYRKMHRYNDRWSEAEDEDQA